MSGLKTIETANNWFQISTTSAIPTWIFFEILKYCAVHNKNDGNKQNEI